MLAIEQSGNVRRDIALRMAMLSRVMRNDFDRRVAEHGITRSQWTVIAVVAGMPGASQRTIAEMLEVSEAAAGRSIDRLCSEGLLERRSRSDDRRAREIYLGPGGEDVLGKIGAIAAESEATAFAGLSDAELQALLRALDRVYANVGGIARTSMRRAQREAAPERTPPLHGTGRRGSPA